MEAFGVYLKKVDNWPMSSSDTFFVSRMSKIVGIMELRIRAAGDGSRGVHPPNKGQSWVSVCHTYKKYDHVLI